MTEKNECKYCRDEIPKKVAHSCISEYATRFTVLQRLCEKVYRVKDEYEKEHSVMGVPAELDKLFDAIEGMKLAHGGAASKEVLERIERSIAVADAALWVDMVGDDSHRAIFDEAKIKWAKYKALNDCPRYPGAKISDEIDMCRQLIRKSGEMRNYSTKETTEVIHELRARLEKLTNAAAGAVAMKAVDVEKLLVPVSMEGPSEGEGEKI